VRLGRTGGRYYSPPSVCRRRVLRLGRQLAYSVHPSSRQTGDRRFADPFSQGGDRPGAWGVVYFVSGGFRKRGGLHCVWQVVACARFQTFFFFFFFFYFCSRLSSRLSLSQKRMYLCKPDSKARSLVGSGCQHMHERYDGIQDAGHVYMCAIIFCVFIFVFYERCNVCVCARDRRISLRLSAVFRARYCGGDLQDVDFGGGGEQATAGRENSRINSLCAGKKEFVPAKRGGRAGSSRWYSDTLDDGAFWFLVAGGEREGWGKPSAEWILEGKG